MGILRTDRVSGLGGADAITGSVFLGGKQRIVIDPHDDFNFSNNDFTLECWINFSGFNGDGFDTIAWGGSDGTATTRSIQFDYKNTSNELRLITSVSDSGTTYASSFTALKDVWYHLAVCRSSSDLKLFVNGTQIGSTHNIGSNVIDYDTVPFNIGMRPGNDDRGVIGHISNFRIINGTALYTSNFSVPTTRLTSVTNTALLCCQSSGNIFEDQSLVKKKFTFHRNNTNDAPPMASHFTPNSPVGFSTTTDVGSQYGSTFDGFGSFATSTYMVPPGGNTRERNRGRGIFADGDQSKTIEFINIQSLGNAQDFGDSTTDFKQRGSVSSSTRTATAGGFSSPAFTNIIDFITIASTANATDFGDLTLARRGAGSAGNSTRGIYLGGGSPGSTNTIDFITIATAGNASDFGDATAAKQSAAALASPTRAVYGGGQDNTIEFVTIATTGNASDFGDLISGTTEQPAGTSSSTRGLFICGESQPSGTKLNTIQFITIATTGNATDFGDNTFIVRSIAACNNSLRAVYGGGNLAPASATTNALSYVTIATTGNGQDFGDLIGARNLDNCVGSSDSHGGLS
mgnify:CR=1 FL=1